MTALRLAAPRALTAALAALTLAFGAPSSASAESGVDFSAMSEEERAAFGAAVRSYLIENPEVLAEAIAELEKRRAEEEQSAERDLVAQFLGALHDTSYSWEGGNPEGDITVVEFLDYRCGFCKRAHPAVKEALDTDGNFRLIVKEFPILGPDSVAAGRMAMAAYRIDAELYPQLNDELMSFQGQLDETAAYRIAGLVGYDIANLKSLANSDEIGDQINRNYQLAEALRIQGTPTFIVGGRILRGFLPADEFVAVIDEERQLAN